LGLFFTKKPHIGSVLNTGIFFSVLYTKKGVNMRSLLYLIAVILLIGWLLGVFVYSAAGLIHILIVLAIISFLLAIIRGDAV